MDVCVCQAVCGPCYLNDDCSLFIHCDYSVVMSSSEHLQRWTVTSLQHSDIEPVTQHTLWCFHYNFLIREARTTYWQCWS